MEADKNCILLVIKDPEEAKAISESLSGGFFTRDRTPSEVLVCHDLEEAVKQIVFNDFIAVLADVGRGEEEGVKFIKRLAQKSPDWTPVFALVGARDEKAEMELISAGAQEYITKPGLLDGSSKHAIAVAIERASHFKKMHYTWKRFMEMSVDPVMVIDINGVVRFVNKAMGKIMDAEERDLKGEMFGVPVMSGETMEVDLITRGGQITTLEMFLQRTEWEGEEAALATLKNGSSYINPREAHRIIEEKCRYLASISAQSAYEIKLDDSGEKTLAWANKKFCRMMGFKERDLTAYKNLLEFIVHPDDRDSAEELSRMAWQGSEETRKVRALTRKDVVKPVSVTTKPFIESMSGRVTNVIFVIKKAR